MSCTVILKEKGLKLTPQRRLIVDIIHRSGAHISAEEIIKHVQKKMPGVNKATIYRTLELLEGLGCVVRSEADKRSIYHHAEEGHHHHLVCNSCGTTIDCDEDLFLIVEAGLDKKYGFQCDLKHMMIQGLCRDCKARA